MTRTAQNGGASGPATSASVDSRRPGSAPASPVPTWRTSSTATASRPTVSSRRIDGTPIRSARSASWRRNRTTAPNTMPSSAVPARNAVTTIWIGVNGPCQNGFAAMTPNTAPSVIGATMAVHVAAVHAYWWTLGWSVNMLQTSTRSTTR